jgi:uncharacterized lipoprotein YmbA
MARALGIALAALAALGALACRLPRPSAPPRYWILTPVDGGVAHAKVERTLGVGPLELPAYLDRAGVVTRSGARLEVAPFDLWGQPLAENATHVLGRNLEHLLPGTSVELFPWKVSARELDRRVAVRVARFEADGDGAVQLEVSWDLRDGSGTELLSSGRASIREPVGRGGGVEEIVGAMSRALGQLSREIAAQLQGG